MSTRRWRFYPQHFQPWSDFASTRAETLDKLAEVFTADGGAYFPSIHSIEDDGGNVSPAVADEQDLRPFIRVSIEKPAALIVSKYLELTSHPTVASVRFRNNAYGLDVGLSAGLNAQEYAEQGQQGQEGQQGQD
ncbi:hypothetical protein SCUCBS95973_001511 [Sporothrix curviconia]|uniref:Uncharacterized protein n=1 Tax=Sporothrix curviconia TaxID=1260050 RepID=A0ABP0AZ73_9PEZI